jgi:adenosylhomocysteinase
MGSETVTVTEIREAGHARVLHLQFRSNPKDARKKVAHLLDRMTVEGRLRGGWREQAGDRWQAALPNGASVTVLLDQADRSEAVPEQSWTLTLVADTGERGETADMFRSARRLPFTDYEMGRIRGELPITAGFAARHPGRPLAGVGVLVTIHHMTDFLILVEALVGLGVEPRHITVIDKEYPYAHTERVDAYLVDIMGIRVHRYTEIQAGIADHVERLEANGLRSIIMDDGGYVVPVVHRELPQIKGHWIGLVEQTMSGIWKLAGIDLWLPVFSVAESDMKATIESYGVADAAVRNVLTLLPNEKFEGRPALVVGFGRLGRQIAAVLRARRMRVAVFDTSIARLLAAHEEGYVTRRTLPELVGHHQPKLVMGAAGERSFGAADAARLAADAYAASVTSRNYEFDLTSLEELAGPMVPLGVLGGAYDLPQGARLTMLGNGMPINFHYAESLPNRYVDLVMAGLLVGALQIAARDGSLAVGHNVASTNELLAASGILDQYYSLYGPAGG